MEPGSWHGHDFHLIHVSQQTQQLSSTATMMTLSYIYLWNQVKQNNYIKKHQANLKDIKVWMSYNFIYLCMFSIKVLPFWYFIWFGSKLISIELKSYQRHQCHNIVWWKMFITLIETFLMQFTHWGKCGDFWLYNIIICNIAPSTTPLPTTVAFTYLNFMGNFFCQCKTNIMICYVIRYASIISKIDLPYLSLSEWHI